MTFDDVLKVLGLLGGIAGAITLVWRLSDVRKTFLHIGLTVEGTAGARVKLRTEVKNVNTVPRKLDSAFLVIGPASEPPEDTIIALLNKSDGARAFDKLRDVVRAVTDRMRKDTSRMADDSGRIIIPLTYYFQENIDVADEVLSYEQIIDCTVLPPGPYAARFYIEGIPWLHRVVHASFEVSTTSSGDARLRLARKSKPSRVARSP